jgi:hypothetical protein
VAHPCAWWKPPRAEQRCTKRLGGKWNGWALSAAKDAGVSAVDDPEATSTVLVAAQAYLPIAQMLIGRTPGNIDAERFREAWLKLAEGAFTGTPTT